MYESGPTGACCTIMPKADAYTCINISSLNIDVIRSRDNQITKLIITGYLRYCRLYIYIYIYIY